VRRWSTKHCGGGHSARKSTHRVCLQPLDIRGGHQRAQLLAGETFQHGTQARDVQRTPSHAVVVHRASELSLSSFQPTDSKAEKSAPVRLFNHAAGARLAPRPPPPILHLHAFKASQQYRVSHCPLATRGSTLVVAYRTGSSPADLTQRRAASSFSCRFLSSSRASSTSSKCTCACARAMFCLRPSMCC
jgi:hypothetical protein